MGFKDEIAQKAIDAFDRLSPDLSAVYSDAAYKTVPNWCDKQIALATASGATSVILPGAHVAAILADVAFLINRMSVCSFGIGAIRGYDNGHGNLLEQEDLANVLGYWARDEQIMSAVTSKGAADIAVKVGSKAGGKVAVKLISKHLATGAGLLVGKKLGGKVGAKIGAKFAAKFGAKLGTGFIPFLGPVVGGGINAYFVNEIADAANDFYRWKCDVARRLG